MLTNLLNDFSLASLQFYRGGRFVFSIAILKG